MMLLKMAWLNIWRNPRRTLILMCAIVVGLSGVIFLIGFMNSWMDSMVETKLRSYTGHIKVYGPGYKNDPIAAHCMQPDPRLLTWLADDPRIRGYAERVVFGGLISSARETS